MQEVIQYYEDYNIGDSRITLGRTITETDIVMHAMHTGDFFPHHVDEEFAKKGPFGKRIAQFSLTHSIGIALTAGRVNPKAFTYGFERLRFPNPVFIGDTITTTVTIKEMKNYPKDPDKFGMVNEACEVLNQNKKCVSYSEHILLVEKKKD
jgi:acyl dehydratase